MSWCPATCCVCRFRLCIAACRQVLAIRMAISLYAATKLLSTNRCLILHCLSSAMQHGQLRHSQRDAQIAGMAFFFAFLSCVAAGD